MVLLNHYVLYCSSFISTLNQRINSFWKQRINKLDFQMKREWKGLKWFWNLNSINYIKCWRIKLELLNGGGRYNGWRWSRTSGRLSKFTAICARFQHNCFGQPRSVCSTGTFHIIFIAVLSLINVTLW